MPRYTHYPKDLLDIAILYSDLPIKYTDYGEDILPEEYLSAQGDWVGEWSRLISSRMGTYRVAQQLADFPKRKCERCGWLCDREAGSNIIGCPACNWTNLDEDNGLG